MIDGREENLGLEMNKRALHDQDRGASRETCKQTQPILSIHSSFDIFIR